MTLEAEEPGVARMLGAIDDLRKLEDDWDSEGASKPAPEALDRAAAVIMAAAEIGLEVDEADADVHGGVALYFTGANEQVVWIGCMNSGSDTIVFSRGGVVTRYAMFDKSLLRDVRDFLAPT